MAESGNAGGSGTVPRAAATSTPALAVNDGGSGGVPVLFLHSFAGDASHWAAQLAHLRTSRRALAFDFAGHGASRLPRARDYSIRSLILDVETVVDARRLDEFVLVGHSLGATVAAGYAGSHPQRVVGLLLVDPPPAPGSIPAAQVNSIIKSLQENPIGFVEQYWNTQLFVGATPAVKEKLLEALRRLPRDLIVQLTTDLFRYDPVPSLSHYSGPKLAVVTPRNDSAASLHKTAPDIEHVVVPGTGHWIQLDKPAEFMRILDEFLARFS